MSHKIHQPQDFRKYIQLRSRWYKKSEELEKKIEILEDLAEGLGEELHNIDNKYGKLYGLQDYNLIASILRTTELNSIISCFESKGYSFKPNDCVGGLYFEKQLRSKSPRWIPADKKEQEIKMPGIFDFNVKIFVGSSYNNLDSNGKVISKISYDLHIGGKTDSYTHIGFDRGEKIGGFPENPIKIEEFNEAGIKKHADVIDIICNELVLGERAFTYRHLSGDR